jgi:hypothetical protein
MRTYLLQPRFILAVGGWAVTVRTYEDLKVHVEGQGHVGVYQMALLRDIEGAGKLGIHIRKKISEELGAHGLGHLPEDLPIYQEQAVRVFTRNSKVGRTIDAVLHPSTAGDALLRSIADDDAQRKVDEIERILTS